MKVPVCSVKNCCCEPPEFQLRVFSTLPLPVELLFAVNVPSPAVIVSCEPPAKLRALLFDNFMLSRWVLELKEAVAWASA